MRKRALLFLTALTLCVSGCAEAPPAQTLPAVSEPPVSESAAPETEEASRPLTMVCLGDSITAGVFELIQVEYGYDYVYEPQEAYPAKLQELLEHAGANVTVVNAGVSGDTVSDGIDRLEPDVFAYSPDIVTVCFGLNDVCTGDGELYRADLSALFDTLRLRLPDAELIFMTPNMLATYVHPGASVNRLNYSMALSNAAIMQSGELDRFMDIAREVCAEKEIPVCDAYAHWKGMADSGVDITELLCTYVTHPTREMQTVFAELLFPYVSAALVRLRLP